MSLQAQIQSYLNGNDELHQALGIDAGLPLPLRVLAQGEYNLNYRFERPADGRPFILRVNMGSQLHLERQISYEATALRALYPSGRTPQVYYVDDSKRLLEQGVLVEDLLSGRPLCYERAGDLDEAARILADVHALRPPKDAVLLCPADPLAAILEESEELYARYLASSYRLSAAEPYLEAFIEAARAIVAGESARPRPRHIISTELNSENFLINDEAPGFLIDWEKPILGEVAQDLAHFLIPTTTFWKTDSILSPTERQSFLERYAQAVDGRFDVTELFERFAPYLSLTCLRAISWCAMAYTEYCEPGRALRNKLTFEKIVHYLRADFLDYLSKECFAMGL
ncbi:MAG: phosphotransferase [Coriobacteriales bacterium]|jgi:aminoglycoside phosphotransferase (APT) family kinase protein|nr:phosphotransferase [Coriobacteriales bacterium]